MPKTIFIFLVLFGCNTGSNLDDKETEVTCTTAMGHFYTQGCKLKTVGSVCTTCEYESEAEAITVCAGLQEDVRTNYPTCQEHAQAWIECLALSEDCETCKDYIESLAVCQFLLTLPT